MELSYPLNLDEYIGAEIVQLWHYGRTTGVFSANANLAVTPAGAMKINISSGAAWLHYSQFGAVVFANTEIKELTIALGEAVLPRIDRVCVRYDIVANTVLLTVKKGTPASNPMAPALQRNLEAYEICIADVRVNAGTYVINAAMIVDQRLNQSVCGLVRDGVEGLPTQDFHNQWMNMLAIWQQAFDSMYEQQRQESAMYAEQFAEWFNNLMASIKETELGEFVLQLAGTVYVPPQAMYTISVSGWTRNVITGIYEYTIANADIQISSDVLVAVQGNMIGKAVLSGGAVVDGGIKLYARTQPPEDYNVLVSIHKQAAGVPRPVVYIGEEEPEKVADIWIDTDG